MRVLWLVLGAIALVVGIIWTLQGVGILGGSFMSGRGIFSVIGLVVIVVGLVLVGIGVGRFRAPNA